MSTEHNAQPQAPRFPLLQRVADAVGQLTQEQLTQWRHVNDAMVKSQREQLAQTQQMMGDMGQLMQQTMRYQLELTQALARVARESVTGAK